MNDTPFSQNNPPTPDAPQPVQQSVRVALPQSAPYVTYGLIGMTSLIFVLQMLSIAIFGRADNGMDLLEVYGALVGSAVRAGQLWRLLTPMLLHDNTFFLHIVFNMYALYSLGIGIERYFGHQRFLLLYVLAGFSGNVMSFLISSQVYAYSIGASTAIFGLIGAEAIFLIQNRKMFAGQFNRAIGNVIFIIALNLFLVGSLPGIDNWGHIGGLLGGLMFTSLAGPVWQVESNMVGGFSLADKRSLRDVMTGAAAVVFVFGALVLWGMIR